MTKKLNIIGTALILALVSMLVCEPAGWAYFSSQSSRNISINATAPDEIWSVSFAFNEDDWARALNSAIFVTNKTDQEIMVFSEYTGDLKQVFKYCDPVKIPAGQTIEIPLIPLDGADSPRILNPDDLIQSTTELGCGEGSSETLNLAWRCFSGTVKLHLLNDYASVESGTINISGKTLWCVYFASKYGLDAHTYYMEEWQNISLKDDVSEPTGLSSETESGSGGYAEMNDNTALPGIIDMAALPETSAETRQMIAEGLQEQNQQTISGMIQYQALEFVMPVLQAVEQLAPGLLEERSYYQSQIQALILESEALSRLVGIYIRRVCELEATIADQLQQMESMQNQLNEKDTRIAELEQQLYYASQSQTANYLISTVVENPGTTGLANNPTELPVAADPVNTGNSPDIGNPVDSGITTEESSPAEDTVPVDDTAPADNSSQADNPASADNSGPADNGSPADSFGPTGNIGPSEDSSQSEASSPTDTCGTQE